jgi:hypothetical protein
VARTWEPRPSANRPPDSRCIDHAVKAIAVGLRAKAIATDVPTPSVLVAAAAAARTTIGSSLVSSHTSRSYPSSSTRRACSAMRVMSKGTSGGRRPGSTFPSGSNVSTRT